MDYKTKYLKYKKKYIKIKSEYVLKVINDYKQSGGTKQLDNLLAAITCPITLEICIDPVIAADGNTYDRNAILK